MLSKKIKKQISEGLDKVSVELLQRRYNRLLDVKGARRAAIMELEKEFNVKDIKFDPKDENKIIDFKVLDYSPDPLLMGEDVADSKTVYALYDLLKIFEKQIRINLMDQYFVKIDALERIITLENIDSGKKIEVKVLDSENNEILDEYEIVEPMLVKRILDKLDRVTNTTPVKM